MTDNSHSRDYIPGASRMPPPPPEAIVAIEGASGRLRAEVEATTEPKRKGRLLYEVGEISERGGDEASAARDYLTAYNADTEFREPLEGLVRLLERRRSLSNLGKLLEALVRAAETPDERVRALIAHATFCADVQNDFGGARGAAKEATEAGAPPHEAAAAWLFLEHTAGKLEDAALREEALEGRAALPSEIRFRDLLRLDLAGLRAASGDAERAINEYEALVAEKSSVSYSALQALERLFAAGAEDPDRDHSRSSKKKLAQLLERIGDLLVDVRHDIGQADALGIPRWTRELAHIALAWIRASELRASLGDQDNAALVLDRLITVIETEHTEGAHAPGVLERVVMFRRLRLAEQVGDTELSARIATQLLTHEQDPREKASLAMRVAEHAATLGDRAAAIDALTEATRADPANLPARSLELDLLAEGDPTRFAGELAKFASSFEQSEAKLRAAMLSAFLLATEGENQIAAAKAAIENAMSLGLAKDLAARFMRTLASLANDRDGYDEATLSLANEVDDDEAALLFFELARARAERKDAVGEKAALDKLASLPAGAFVARAIEAFGSASSTEGVAASSVEAVEKLAALTDSEDARRGLLLIAAIRAHAGGNREQARALAEKAGDSLLVSVFRAELETDAGHHARAAEILAKTAERSEDAEVAAALDLESGVLLFHAGNRAAALAAFVRADEREGGAPSRLTAYAALAASPDAIESRRQALDYAEGAGLDANVVALDKFATEALAGDVERAREAASKLDVSEAPDFVLAGALGRLLVSDADAGDAISRIAAAGEAAALFAQAERLKRARTLDPAEHAEAAHAWMDAGAGTPAGIEWLAAALRSNDMSTELSAREALAKTLHDDHTEILQCSAALLRSVAMSETPATLSGTSAASRLANLELAPPGCEPERRAAVLSSLDGALGDASETAAMALAAWNKLASGDVAGALATFQNVTTACPEDLASWEGLRLAAERIENREVFAMACEQLGARCVSDARGAEFWDRASAVWLGLGSYDERAEHALTAALTRDPKRSSAFDTLFRRVRDRKDGDAMLALIEARLEHTDDHAEIAKLYWEQARVLREKKNPEGALVALEHVTMLEPDHVGALALTGEIFIRRGMYEEAASHLARLARVESAPAKNRVTAGVTAVDLYENKLGRHDLALDVLLHLHRAKLSTLPVRERLARAAARTGTWQEALPILEGLMHEREAREGRIEAARLAMAIYRDKLMAPERALPAIEKLLSEAPADGEALDLLLAFNQDSPQRRKLLTTGKDALIRELGARPVQPEAMRRLARVAQTVGDPVMEQAALAASIAQSGADPIVLAALANVSQQKGRIPQTTLTDALFRRVLSPEDQGPIADLFVLLGPTLAEALGPQLTTVGVTKKDRVDARTGLAIRSEIGSWAGAFGLGAFDLYVGGRDPFGVQGIAGETAAIVVGASVNAPLTPQMRGRVARELTGMLRGSTVTRWRDDLTIAAIVVASCNIAKVPVNAPNNAVLADVERLIAKAIPRKVRASIEPVCRKIVETTQDPKAWAHAARASLARAALLASGDVSVVLADLLGEPLERIAQVSRDDMRAEELFRYLLSADYVELRMLLGLETSS